MSALTLEQGAKTVALAIQAKRKKEEIIAAVIFFYRLLRNVDSEENSIENDEDICSSIKTVLVHVGVDFLISMLLIRSTEKNDGKTR